jgi:biotin transport system substrate-specific component
MPFTMQTFAVFSALFCLGGKKGTLSIAVYLFMGAVGLPVFSGFSAGIGVLWGANGGFLFGFLISALIYTLLEKTHVNRLISAFISMLFCYISGSLWFFAVYSESKGTGSLMSAFLVCVVPFIIPDIIKILLALYISKRLKKHI